jgi:hypothetical protein
LTYNSDKWAIGSDELAITKISSRAITTTNNSNAANATAITQKYGQQRVGNKHNYVTILQEGNKSLNALATSVWQ